MAENQSPAENKEIGFDNSNLTPFEHTMIGSSDNYSINGKLVNVTSRNIAELVMNQDSREIVLSPISYKEGKRSLNEVREVRSKKGYEFATNIFEKGVWLRYYRAGKIPAFRLGELDEDGLLKELSIFLVHDSKKTDLPENILADLPLSNTFRNILEFTDIENNEIKFRIKDFKNN